MSMPTREQFVAAYSQITGTSEDWAGEVYDAIDRADSAEFRKAIVDVCERVAEKAPEAQP